MDVVAIDIETTGLETGIAEITEIGFVRMTQDWEHELCKFSIKVKPTHMETASPKALEVFGWVPEAWEHAVDLRTAMSWTSALSMGSIPMGHNVQFDLKFLNYEWSQLGIPLPWVTSEYICTMAMVAPLARRRLIQNKKLDSACAYFNVERPKIHRALDDAVACLEVAKRIKAWETNNQSSR